MPQIDLAHNPPRLLCFSAVSPESLRGRNPGCRDLNNEVLNFRP